MSEFARHQFLVTLVHGTWPRGFFPTLRRRNRDPLWFEESSPFLARLSAEFGDIPHKIKPLPWSGENSIYARDKAAHVLAEYLSAEHNEHPQATQLIIAHSHGGNIALRALYLSQQRDSSQLCGGDSAIPDATRFGQLVSAQAQRLLVIRAIDDEASLALALGTIFYYVATRTIKYLFAVLPIVFSLLSFMLGSLLWESGGWLSIAANVAGNALIILLGALAVSRSVHGRELAVSPMECQINTQSVPDATDLSRIVTLISHGYVKSLRHGIYEHENCTRAISDWIRSQL
jgi:hypothetical protein